MHRRVCQKLVMFLERGHLLIPIAVLVYTLIIGYSPTYSATIAIVLTVLVSCLKTNTRMSIKKFLDAMSNGASNAISICIVCAILGILVEAISMTGVGSTIATGIFKLSRGIPLFSAFLVMVVSLVASVGLPATACYIIVVTVAAPALLDIGIPILAAHFFVFWFGCISGMTPPVALASYTAAGIAKADPFKTAIEGLRLSFVGFLIPFLLFLIQNYCYMEEI